LVVCPSDHHIEDAGRFADAVAKAARLAREGWLVCLGVEAKAAETRFGYIRRGEPLGPDGFQIREFVEKPAADVAAGFIASGQFAWNSGIFVFRAGNFLDELDRHHPEAAGALSKSVSAGRSADAHFFPDGPAFSAVQVESVDRAIMETTDRAALVMTETGWSDVGDWRTLYAERPKDSDGNSVRGPAELLDCRNMLVDTDGPRVHLIGLENVIVVIDGDDILIANAAQSEKVARLNGARRR
jgi:mannose-1-phosphate guanylyltransferase